MINQLYKSKYITLNKSDIKKSFVYKNKYIFITNYNNIIIIYTRNNITVTEYNSDNNDLISFSRLQYWKYIRSIVQPFKNTTVLFFL